MNREKLRAEKERIGTWGKINLARLKTTELFAGKRVLEIGCADGTMTNILHRKGYVVCGVDLLFSTNWQPAPGKWFVVADVHQLPFGAECFDTVLAFEVLEHLSEVNQAFEEMVRVCRKNLLLTTPDAELHPHLRESGLVYSPWADRTHVNFFTAKELRAFMESKGLVLTYFSKINPVYPERILLENFGLPAAVTRFLLKFLRHLPRRNKLKMTLLAVAEKRKQK